jgi:hypothetical protein
VLSTKHQYNQHGHNINNNNNNQINNNNNTVTVIVTTRINQQRQAVQQMTATTTTAEEADLPNQINDAAPYTGATPTIEMIPHGATIVALLLFGMASGS